jgi:transposase
MAKDGTGKVYSGSIESMQCDRGTIEILPVQTEHPTDLLEVIDFHESEEIKKALLELLLELGDDVEEVRVDRWEGLSKILTEIFPNAKIVINRFHIIKKRNEGLNKVISG